MSFSAHFCIPLLCAWHRGSSQENEVIITMHIILVIVEPEDIDSNTLLVQRWELRPREVRWPFQMEPYAAASTAPLGVTHSCA